MNTETQPSRNRTRALPAEKMPGHWLLARLGKRVLRPGGVELTTRMLGLGATARRVLARNPASYIGVERDEAAAAQLTTLLAGVDRQWLVASAERTGLPDCSASVVYGEALLTMLPEAAKRRVIAEAYRVLKPGGRYGIHELCLVPEDLDPAHANRICGDLSDSIHVGARPHKARHWRGLLEATGFTMSAVALEHRAHVEDATAGRGIAQQVGAEA